MKYYLSLLLISIASVCNINDACSNTRTTTFYRQARSSAAMLNSSTDSNTHTKGLYFGESKDSDGRRAWFLYFDPEVGKGILYMPPNNLALSTKITSSGQVIFHSEGGIGDVVYRFDGHFAANYIEGKIHITRTRPSAKEDVSSISVTLRKIDVDTLSKAQGTSISGLYSSAKYNNEGGDVTGDELILIPNGGGFEGIFTSFDNEMIPYVMTNIVQSGNKLQFNVQTDTGEETYQGTLLPQKVTLKRSDMNADPKAEQLILLKESGVFDILTATTRREG